MRASHYAGSQIAEIRGRRGLSQHALAQQLRARGERAYQATVTRVETGDRRLTIDELVAYAAVLNVSPTTLLLPDERTASTPEGATAEVHVTDADVYPAWVVRSWIEGNGPLPAAADDDEHRREQLDRDYFDEQPEWRRREHATFRDPTVGAVQQLLHFVREARIALDGGRPGSMTAKVLGDSLRDQWRWVGEGVEYLAKSLDRMSQTTGRKANRTKGERS